MAAPISIVCSCCHATLKTRASLQVVAATAAPAASSSGPAASAPAASAPAVASTVTIEPKAMPTMPGQSRNEAAAPPPPPVADDDDDDDEGHYDELAAQAS
eukprot:CAMPEP_0177365836 /NCGR_PEP_ID=MMETSP0368-20130122/39539_1 /TAXON_ID=447022 ORGANISM="Scrippsiella hangoei-like, Strain SHHI-4" /NCGR_SAMPLE_ID=MMETSP0368 /ASSEMBLY_ACC=CAM_ASM_000363 /LENGTH=100 /DNA_ID=CAMNT_0018828797 /DNA_START=27 /DNA_END=326 /DNA_ORIENTATION=+